jgi:hypothetical protein
MIDITSMRETVSLKVDNSEEVLSVGQVMWVLGKLGKGCTAECLACHFSELFLRDIHPEVIESIIGDEYTTTDLPSHGSQILQTVTRPIREIAVPDGIYYKVGDRY